MKTLEERLRELQVDAEHGRYTEEEKGKRRCYNNGLEVALAIVADALRIEPAPADWSGNIHDSPDWVEDFIRHEGVWYFSSKRFAALSNSTQGVEQTPTNSPSEGKG